MENGAELGAAHSALAHLARQLGAAQQITHIGSWEWHVGGSTVTWSDELYRIYGLEPQSREITFEFFVSCLLAEDRERVTSQVGQALARGGRFQYPERIVRPDGSVRYLETVGEAARDDRGAVVALLGTCRDVTDERRREETIELYRHIVESVQIGLMAWRVPDPEDAGSATLIAVNKAAERALDLELGARAGARLRDLLPGLAGGELGKLLADVARDDMVREIEEQQLDDRLARSFALKAFPLPSGSVGIAIEDVTVHARARRLREAEKRVLEMVASEATLGQILTTLALLIEELAPPAIASVLLHDHAEGGRMRHGAAPNLPEAYNRAIDGAAIGPSAGSCGTCVYLRKSIFVNDIDTDERWREYRELARSHGLRACWSVPIFASDERVLGTFAMYYREPRHASPEDLELIARAGHVAGLAIERRELDDQLRALSAHTEAAREQERTGIAREIHDVLGQALTALKIDLAWIARKAGGDEIVSRTGAMSQMIDDLIGSIRRMSAELRPGELDDLGLLAALEWQTEELRRRTEMKVELTSNLGAARPERNLETAVFRIAQEGLTNVVRHAAATRVDVRLERAGDVLRLEVRDDGRGITADEARNPRALGLLGVRERARALGGRATIGAVAPRGTLLAVDLPYREA